jgi:hypothetical protein
MHEPKTDLKWRETIKGHVESSCKSLEISAMKFAAA